MDEPWLKNKQWAKREVLGRTVVGGVYVLLAYLVLGSIELTLILVAIAEKRPETVFGAVAMLGVVVPILFILTRWWWRKVRYGGSVCRLITLPGVVGGWFKAEVECGLPPEAAPVTLRLRNILRQKGEPEVWRMEKTLASLAPRASKNGCIVAVRLQIPKHPAQRPMIMKPSLFFGDTNMWVLEVEKKTAGHDFYIDFEVPIYDTEHGNPAEQ